MNSYNIDKNLLRKKIGKMIKEGNSYVATFYSGYIEDIYEAELLKNLPKSNFIRYLLDLGFHECISTVSYSGVEKIVNDIDEKNITHINILELYNFIISNKR